MLEGLADWVVALSSTPWVFVALYAFATIDGFFPPVPSESVIIALAATAMAEGVPNLWILGAVAAAGAFTGDQIAYSLGRRLPVGDLRMMRGKRQQRALRWADRALADRGAAFIIAARYVPVGRVAVNMTAGAVGFSRVRFTVLAAIAAVSWAAYSVLLGVGAGAWLGDNTILAVAVGVAGGLALGFALDPVIAWFIRRRLGRSERAARSLADRPGGSGAPVRAAAVRPEA
ncbi:MULTISPECIES: DedA family protein [unclassified Actinotalea]|uniref:DedA family protein n=1 Tax=unclassified Actinotalea TaxID=2638618 RepID=UPI002103B6D5|nr:MULTISPECIES: VTT domain-containing protein [unclassified Actinotalea]